MSYKTKFTITYNEKSEAIDRGITDTITKGTFCNVPQSGNSFVVEASWYDHVEDMKKLSREFPSTTFTVLGEGEEIHIVWRKFFHNGTMGKEVAKVEVVWTWPGGEREVTKAENY